jgi:hypothetical protein
MAPRPDHPVKLLLRGSIRSAEDFTKPHILPHLLPQAKKLPLAGKNRLQVTGPLRKYPFTGGAEGADGAPDGAAAEAGAYETR